MTRLAVIAGVGFVLAVGAYPDAPPPAHTGGFGEPTCHRCHFGQPLDAPGGVLTLEGVPARYEAGRRYVLTVTLARAGMERAGFQLTARTAGGAQAGALAPHDAGTAVAIVDSTGIRYAGHAEAGSHLASPDTARWRLVWTPGASADTVFFHVAANAANGDASEFGDYVYRQMAHATSE
ncbi:MAG: choice-of-anchor V domain-containing protein [Rhodothermales bacterium]|nr:choice-of-anchor V domain-containing protein [Rhodothermales bacterium]